jgi:hypothetical protein
MHGNHVTRTSLYKPEYCDLLLDDMKKGFSLLAFAGLIGVCRDTLTEWGRVHPEFADAVKRGKAMQVREWETRGIRVAEGLDVKGAGAAASMVQFSLCNLGDGEWRNKQDHTHAGPAGGAIETTHTVTYTGVLAKGYETI